MTTKPKAQPIRLTFDGWGFNDLDDKFRSRFATLPHILYPLPLDDERCEFIVRAVNAHAELTEALEDLREAATDAYKSGRIPAAPFVRAGLALAAAKGTQ